jgi:hypothetical protein
MFARYAISSKPKNLFARYFEQKSEQNSEQTPLRQLFLLDFAKKSSKHDRAKLLRWGLIRYVPPVFFDETPGFVKRKIEPTPKN